MVMTMKCMININSSAAMSVASFSLFSLIVSTPVDAAEDNRMSYPGGVSLNFISSFPPAPGNYLQFLSYYYSADQLNGPDGHELPGVSFDNEVLVQNFRYLRVWDNSFWGADTFISQLILSYGQSDASVAGLFSEKDSGLGDLIFGPIILQWNFGESDIWRLSSGVDFVIPVGSYSSDDAVNIGTNRFSVQPTFGVKYLDSSGFQMAIAPRLSFNRKNSDTDYKTGVELITDFSAGYKMGNWMPGISGYHYQQLSSDELGGEKIADSKASGFTVGPSLEYQFDNGALITAAWHKDVKAENKAKGGGFWLSTAIKF